MLILITYDVSVIEPEGKIRLRKIAKTCLDFGMRVQNSVFECEVDPSQLTHLKSRLTEIFKPSQDSLRFYYLGKKGHLKVEHLGAKSVPDPLRSPLIF